MGLKCNHSAQQRHGYTLIELLLIVAILGLASALLIPQLANRDSMEVQAAVRQLIADLSFAQSDALAHQEYRRVHFYDDGSGYCIYRVTDADFGDPFDEDEADFIFDPLADSDEEGLYVVKFQQEGRYELVTISDASIDGGNRHITFDELGGTVADLGVPGTGGTVTITGGGVSYQLNISPFTGKLTVSEL